MSTLMKMTARDLIRRSMILQGIIGVGENQSDQESNDALLTLNEIVDKWNIENVMISSLASIDIPLNGSQVYTVGPTGDVLIDENISSVHSCYYKFENQGIIMNFKLNLITKTQYDNIFIKEQENINPDYIYINYTYPDTEIYVYPQSNKGSIVLNYDNKFTAFNTLDDVVDLPSGYLKALRYNLAVELGIEYGIAPNQAVTEIAISSKNAIKTINGVNKKRILKMDSFLLNNSFNIRRG